MLEGTRARTPRRLGVAVLAALMAGACAGPDVPTGSPGSTAVPAPSDTPSGASVAPSPPASTEPTPSPTPVSIDLPDGLNDVAWVTATGVRSSAGEWVSTTIAMGLLGRPVAASASLPRTDGYARVVAAGPYAVVLVQGDTNSRIRVYRAADGTLVSELDPRGPLDLEHLVVDPGAGVLYAGVGLSGGGLEVRRISLDGSRSATLFALDDRFTAEATPAGRYGLTLATDGRLVVAACADGTCRVWRVMPDEPGGPAMTLPSGTPELCSVVGATDRWLVTYDEAQCAADTGDAPLPLRGISLATGDSFVIGATPQVLAGRVLVIDGRAVVVASHRSADWSTSDIETLDVRTGEANVLLDSLPNDPYGGAGWIGVAAQQLPGAWVLLEPWGIDPTGPSSLPTRLLDTASGRLIELPLGTAGWS